MLFSSVTIEASKMRAHEFNMREWLTRLKAGLLMTLWFVFSVASLFTAKQVLHIYHINEAVFSLWQFFFSVFFGLLFTKVLRVHELEVLSLAQVRTIVPLSLTFLVKELLKYASLSRISVNLVNTIRSLGPLFNVLLEFFFLGHRPQQAILWALLPIVLGVALTSIDEIHVASISNSLFVAIVGFFSAIFSTAINNAQNIYSKILFGRERIDPVCLQIYLSAISLILMSPITFSQLMFQSFKAGKLDHALVIPSRAAFTGLLLAGFVNFLASQLAFNTLRLVTPLSYSVANTFKRVAIAVIAIFYFSERLSVVNGIGIVISMGGICIYERQSRTLREAKQYRKTSSDRDSFPTGMQHKIGSTPGGSASLPTRKQNASGPDLVSLDKDGNEMSTPMKGEGASGVGVSGETVQRHLFIDMAMSPPNKHLSSHMNAHHVTPLRV